MKLEMNLTDKPKTDRAKKTLQKEKEKKFQPTWEQVWVTGYTRPTGTTKNGIFQSKLSDRDREKLEKVKRAIEDGVIGTQVDDMKKFTKTHAMRLYKHLMEVQRESTIARMVNEKPDNYICVLTEQDFLLMLKQVSGEKYIGLDTETTGLDPFGADHICGLSISCPEADLHYYVPVRHNVEEKQLTDLWVFAKLKSYLEDESLGKVLHNAKFDAHMFQREGIMLKGIIMDTMVSMHILSENEPTYALKNLATKWGKHFGFIDRSATYEELFGKGGFQDTPLDIGTVYACKDTHLVVKFYEWIMSHLRKQPRLMAVHELETKVLKVSIEMEQAGFNVDLDYGEKYRVELEEQVDGLLKQLKVYFGDINLNSNDQLKHALFNELGLPDKNKGSVDASTLKALVNEHEGIAVLLEYRELSKLLSTYIEPLPQKVSPVDKRLHGQFKQSGTATGRYSSSSPNLQNIPYPARKLFLAPEGRLMLGMDFSKVEPTILADMTDDKKFKEPFLAGLDIYSSLASGTFHIPYEDCGDGTKERKMMKTGLLATMYGTSNYTLSQQLKITVDEAEDFINRFLTNYPVVASWIDGVHADVDETGFVETMLGRKRRFIGHKKIAQQFHQVESQVVAILGRKPKNIWSEKKVPYNLRQKYWNIAGKYFRASRQSVNAIIQGTGAEIMKKAMVNVYNLFQELNTKNPDRLFRLLATIHDEILMEVPDDVTLDEIAQIEDRMINCVKMSLPLKVDTEVMKRWGEGKPKAVWFADKGE